MKLLSLSTIANAKDKLIDQMADSMTEYLYKAIILFIAEGFRAMH